MLTPERTPTIRRREAGRFVTCLCVLVASTLLAAPGAAEPPASLDGPSWPRVVWTTDPAHRATVVWTTAESAEDQKVVYQPSARHTDLLAHGRRIGPTRTVGPSAHGVSFHHARLENLHAATAYEFRILSGGDRTQKLHFRTAPDDHRTVRLLYGGDSRSSRERRRDMNRRIRSLVEDHPDILALAHGGDYIVDGRDWRHWRGWLSDWEATVTESGRILPIIPARGNHDLAGDNFTSGTDHYNAVFGRPGGLERDYWTTQLAEHTVLTTLDTNRPLGGTQRDWLERQLSGQADGFEWQLAQYHRPAYPAVKRPGSARLHWVPLFEEFGVDLALESDGHVLKRTVPIRDGEKHEDGVVYVGEGGLGVPQRTPRSGRWYLQSPGMARAVHHVQLLTIGRDSMTYRAVGLDGETLDRASWNAGNPKALSNLKVQSVEVDGPHTLNVHFDAGLAAPTVVAPNFRLYPTGSIRHADRHPVQDDVARLRLEETLPDATRGVTVTDVESLTGRTVDGSVRRAIHPDSSAPNRDEPPKTRSPEEPPSPARSAATTSAGCSHGSPPLPYPALPFTLLAAALAGPLRRRTGRPHR